MRRHVPAIMVAVGVLFCVRMMGVVVRWLSIPGAGIKALHPRHANSTTIGTASRQAWVRHLCHRVVVDVAAAAAAAALWEPFPPRPSSRP